MMMIVETSNSIKSFDELNSDLDHVGLEIGVSIKAQHEDIFNKMHRL